MLPLKGLPPCVASRWVTSVSGSLHQPARHGGLPVEERLPARWRTTDRLSRQHGAARPGDGSRQHHGEHRIHHQHVRSHPQDHRPAVSKHEAGGHWEQEWSDTSQDGCQDWQEWGKTLQLDMRRSRWLNWNTRDTNVLQDPWLHWWFKWLCLCWALRVFGFRFWDAKRIEKEITVHILFSCGKLTKPMNLNSCHKSVDSYTTSRLLVFILLWCNIWMNLYRNPLFRFFFYLSAAFFAHPSTGVPRESHQTFVP